MLSRTIDRNMFSNRFVSGPPTSAHSSPSISSPATTLNSPGTRQHAVYPILSGYAPQTPEQSTHLSPVSSGFSTWTSTTPFLPVTNIPSGYVPSDHPPQLDGPGGIDFSSRYYAAYRTDGGLPVVSQDVDPSCGLGLVICPARSPVGLSALSPNLRNPAVGYSTPIETWYPTRPLASIPGLGNGNMLLQTTYVHRDDTGASPPQRLESLRQVQETPSYLSSPAPSQSSPRPEGQSLNIVMVHPDKPSHRDRRRQASGEEKRQKEEDSRLLKESGGACIWCYLNKKKCDPGRICIPCTNKRGCFRDCSQLWLFVPVLEKSKNLQFAQDSTFQRTYDILDRLKNTSSLQPSVSQVVANIRWSVPESRNLLATNISDLRLSDYGTATTYLKEKLISSTLADMQVPELDCLVVATAKASIVGNAGKMLKLLAAIVTLSRSRVHVPPANVGVARATMFFVLTVHAIVLCEASAAFCSELCEIIRRKGSHQEDSGAETARKSQHLNPLWLAIGIYHEVISGLISFQPGPLISDIFDNIKPRLGDIQFQIRHLLMSVPPYEGPNKGPLKQSMLDDLLSSLVPKVPVLEGGYDLAFWAHSCETNAPTSTVVSRQEMAYDQLQYEMGCLLKEDFDIDMVGHNPSRQVPGPPPTHFRSDPVVDHPAVMDQGIAWSDPPLSGNSLDEQHFPLENDGAYATPQSSEQTVEDTLFSDLTYLDQYSETSGFTLARIDGPFHQQPQTGYEPFLSTDHEQGGAETMRATNLDTSYASTHHIAPVDVESLDF